MPKQHESSSTAPTAPTTPTQYQTPISKDNNDDDQGEEEEIKLKNLQKPIFDESLIKKNDGTVSGSLLAVNAEEPFLCTPLPITESNLLAWLMRGGESGGASRRRRNSSNANDNGNSTASNTTNASTSTNATNATNSDSNSNSTTNARTTSARTTNTRTTRRNTRSKYEKDLAVSFVHGEKLRYATSEAQHLRKLKVDYHNRRELNRILASRLELGTATIDEDGRLVPIDSQNGFRRNNNNNNNDDDNIDIDGQNMARGELPNQGFRNEHDDFQRQRDNENGFLDGNEEDEQMMMHEEDEEFLPAVFGVAAQEWLDEEEERRRNIERQEIDAEDAIAIAVNKYRTEGVHEDDFIFVPIPSYFDDDNNLTFRRIIIAVACVLLAFVCIMMQSFNFMDDGKIMDFDPKFDKLLYDLLNVRSFGTHVQECNGLQRDNENIHWQNSTLSHKKQNIDCNDGVLHIPSINVLSQLNENATKDAYLSSQGLEQMYEPYKNGVNVSWFHECVLQNPPNSTCVLRREYPTDDGDNSNDDTCKNEAPPTACFRGVHDGHINDDEITQLLNLSKLMISRGGDHMTIYDDVDPLFEVAPSVAEKLEYLLRSNYATPKVRPVAFQVGMSFPISYSATSIRAKGAKIASLKEARNDTVFKNWFTHVQRINNWPKIVIPFPSPHRDQCLLVSDLEASENFAFHTSVYLSDGGGIHFSGGVSLFVDNHMTNTNIRHKVQRGVTVDGSQGRIVVNSGGEDNLRCRLPMRDGIRAELNIWWNCVN